MKTFLAFALFLIGASSCLAQDKATMDYTKMYGIFQKAAAVKNKDVRAMIAVVPSNKAIRPGDVTLTIQAKSGPQKLTVDPDGELHAFPMTDALLKENPSVLTNQPKGTLGIGGGIALNLPDGATFSYRQLGALLDAGNAEIKKQAGMLSLVAPQSKTITFEFFDGRGQSLTVGVKSAPKTIRADANGHLVLSVDPALLPENPPVTFSEKPSKALLDI